LNLLEQLVLTPAIPGREHRLRQLILRETQGLFDETRTDPLGSLLCVRNPRNPRPRNSPGPAKSSAKSEIRNSKSDIPPTRIMLAAHMDQIGFMVRHIDAAGFVRVQPVGGFDARNLFARLVTICPDLADPAKDIPGVLNPAGRPLHIATEEDKKKIPELCDFVIDLGLPAKEVLKKVHIGDTVVLKAPFAQIGNTVVSQCLDNRVACWILIRALQQLKHHDCEIIAAFTVQEEVGIRGATTSAFSVQPDIGIAIDTTLAVDTPGVPEDQRVSVCGGGAAITHMDGGSIGDPDLLAAFEKIAGQRKIKHQRSILPRGGTDAAALQRAAAGTRAMTLSCPTRYIHTVTEMVHQTDLHACRDLLAAYLEQT